MPFRDEIPCGDPPIEPPATPEPPDKFDADPYEVVKCCVCEEEHSRLELIDFGNSIKHEYVCLEITCLVDFIGALQEINRTIIDQNAALADKILSTAKDLGHALR